MSTWPAELPQELDQDGYNETLPMLFIRTNTDTAIPKRRRRFSSAIQPITGQVIVTYAQLQIFKDWYMGDLGGGANFFDWVHPTSGEPCVMGFKDAPKITSAGAAFNIAMELEIQP